MAVKKQEVAKVEESTKAIVDSGFVDEMFALQGAGGEDVTAEDKLIPRLAIIQALSDQIKKKHASYIEGAEIGDICDTSLGKLFKGQIIFLPVMYRMRYLEWAPRNTGKGLQEIHFSPEVLDACQRNDKMKYFLENGNEIVPTAEFYGFNVSDDMRPVFIAMSSTQLKKARKWNSLLTGEKVIDPKTGLRFTPPFFFRSYVLSTAEESNNEGEWSGWKIEPGVNLMELGQTIGYDWKQLKADAEAFLNSIRAGEVQADVSSMESDGATIDGTAEEVM